MSGDAPSASAALAQVAAHLGRAVDAVEAAREAMDKAPSNAPSTPFEAPSTAADHRRQHRPGRPGRIDTDAELRAFILARIEIMTFPELADAVAEAFPPERRVAKSAIHRWWHRNGRPSHPE